MNWRQGRCLPYGEGITFWALGEIVKAQAGILGIRSDPEPTAGDKLKDVARCMPDPGSSRRTRLGPDAARCHSSARRWKATRLEENGRNRSRLGCVSLRRSLRSSARRSLMFEDLHWADETMLDVHGTPRRLVREVAPLLVHRDGTPGTERAHQGLGRRDNANAIRSLALSPLTSWKRPLGLDRGNLLESGGTTGQNPGAPFWIGQAEIRCTRKSSVRHAQRPRPCC